MNVVSTPGRQQRNNQLTLRRQVTQSRSTVTLNLRASGVRERNQNFADAHLEQLSLQLIWTSNLKFAVVKFEALNLPLKAKTAMHAVISLCTFIGTSNTSSLMLWTAPAFTIACLFFSELAARFRSVEMA